MTIDPLVARGIATPSVIVPDERLVHAVHERRGQDLFGFARRLGVSDDQAADIVQDALTRMWMELRQGTVIEHPDAWAFRTVYRLAMDVHRLRRRLQRLLPRLAVGRSRDDADPTDRMAVWAEVDLLPARQRHVLYLRFRADLPFEEVGLALGISASAARSHCTSALATLRRRFAADGEER